MQSLLAAVHAHTHGARRSSKERNSSSTTSTSTVGVTATPSSQAPSAAASAASSPSAHRGAAALDGREYSVTRSAVMSSSSQLRGDQWDPCSSVEPSRIYSGQERSPSPVNHPRYLSRPPSSTDHLSDMLQQTSLTERPRQPPQNPFSDRQPHPSLMPEDVIEIQLGAMQQNDVPSADAGIEICFRFASPANRVFTGPVERFARMMHNPLYAIMLGYDDLKFAPANVQGNRWKLTITKGDTRACFMWTLSKQTVAPFKDCWMTDNVLMLQE